MPDPSGVIRIGVSSCLLGEEVRYDGGHRRDRFVTDTLAPFVEYVRVCPEVEMGMGVPRETIHIVRGPAGLRLVGTRTRDDHTVGMDRYARRRTRELARDQLSGYIFKKGSPSCGLFRVEVFGAKGRPARDGRGMFATVFVAANPLLPVEEEGRLNDAGLRENFCERVFAYRRMRDLFGRRFGVGELVRFHTAEKMLVLAHDRKTYAELGRLVASAKAAPRTELTARYQELFMTGLAKRATVRKHTNVLQHAAGHLKRLLSPKARAELHIVIEDYHQGLVPLVVPITLLRHHTHMHEVEYLAGQTYLQPRPAELMLRNHV